MSEFIKYNYASMDTAYDDMRRITDNVIAQLDVLQAEAEKVLAFNGYYVKNYDDQAKIIRQDITDLNETTTKRSKQLADMFADYQETDRSLGSQ